MAFEKGRSGNPGGRPKKSEEQKKFERRCREIAETLGIDRLVYWLKHSNPTASLAALKEINERGFGKSVAYEVIDADVTSDVGTSVEDLRRAIAELAGGGEGKSGGVDLSPSVGGGERTSEAVSPESGAGEVHSGVEPSGGVHRD